MNPKTFKDACSESLTDLSVTSSLAALQEEIIACEQCPRLVSWRTQVAQEKVKRFSEEVYWGKPVPSFQSEHPKLLIAGLAPAAHGANRTGRMFTGDRSGEWLYRALYKAGFANQPDASHCQDGLKLIDAYITATAHCAPPENKPTPEELKNCRPYLVRELQYLSTVQVIVALGKIAFDTVLSIYAQALGHESGFEGQMSPKPKFAHLVSYPLPTGPLLPKQLLIGSYHPSQQNTFTGRLTEPMFDAVFTMAKDFIQKHR